MLDEGINHSKVLKLDCQVKGWQSFSMIMGTWKTNCEDHHNVTVLSSKCDNVHKENERSMNGDS